MSRKEIDTRGFEIETTQEIDPAIGEPRVIAVEGPINGDYLKQLAFMEEEMTVLVHESADENAENPITVGNGGRFVQFWRGVETRARRKFVDCLIVKSGRVSTPEYVNGAGERARAIRQTSAHKYPFSVIEDPNPKVPEWLRSRMAELV